MIFFLSCDCLEPLPLRLSLRLLSVRLLCSLVPDMLPGQVERAQSGPGRSCDFGATARRGPASRRARQDRSPYGAAGQVSDQSGAGSRRAGLPAPVPAPGAPPAADAVPQLGNRPAAPELRTPVSAGAAFRYRA